MQAVTVKSMIREMDATEVCEMYVELREIRNKSESDLDALRECERQYRQLTGNDINQKIFNK